MLQMEMNSGNRKEVLTVLVRIAFGHLYQEVAHQHPNEHAKIQMFVSDQVPLFVHIQIINSYWSIFMVSGAGTGFRLAGL